MGFLQRSAISAYHFLCYVVIAAAACTALFSGCASDDGSHGTDASSGSALEASGPWNVVVLSDIHVTPSKPVPRAHPRFNKLVADILTQGQLPDLVLVTGDTTNGNSMKGETLKLIRPWWDEAIRALSPFCNAGIPVFIVAGNHDYEEEPHKQAYREAWEKLRACNGRIALLPGGKTEAYSFNHKGVHFQMAHVEDKALEPGYEAWMRDDLAKSQAQHLRFVFGHVPMLSVMNEGSNRGQRGFRNQIGAIIADGHAAAYIAGHEHLVWDEEARLSDGRTARQVIVGTASATYRYGLHAARMSVHCRGTRCKFPCAASCFKSRFEDCPCTEFQASPGSGKQEGLNAFARIVFSGAPGAFEIKHFTTDRSGEIVPFGRSSREPASALTPAKKKKKRQ